MITKKEIEDLRDKEIEKSKELLYENLLNMNDLKSMYVEINSQFEEIFNKYDNNFKKYGEEWFLPNNKEVVKSINDLKNDINSLESIVDKRRSILTKKENNMENNKQTNTITEKSENKKEGKFYGILPKLLTTLKGDEKKDYFRVVLNYKGSVPSYADEKKDKIRVYLPKPLLPNWVVNELGERDNSYSIIVDANESGTFELPSKEDNGENNELNKKTVLVLNKNKMYSLKRNDAEKAMNGEELLKHLTENRKVNLWEWKPEDFIVKIYNEDLIEESKKENYFTLRLSKKFTPTFTSNDEKTRFVSIPKKLLSEEDAKKELFLVLEPQDIKSYFYINKENNEKVSKYSILIQKSKTYSLFNKKSGELEGTISGNIILASDKENKFTKPLWTNLNKTNNDNELPEDLDNIFDENSQEQK